MFAPVAEYALSGMNRPIGVANYKTRLVESLPKNLRSSLPTIEEIEAELRKHEELTMVKREQVVPKRTKRHGKRSK